MAESSDFRWAYRSVATGHFVGPSFRGKKKRVKVKINRGALMMAAKRAAKRATAKRFQKHKKTLAKKRTKAAKKTGIRSLGMRQLGKYTNKFYQLYDIPFTLQTVQVDGKNKREYLPDYSAIKSIFDIEKQGVKGFPPYINAWINCIFKDGDDQWVSVGKDVLADEPGGANILYEAIVKMILQYEIRQVLSIHLHVNYGEGLTGESEKLKGL